jgi:hypothetical protein
MSVDRQAARIHRMSTHTDAYVGSPVAVVSYECATRRGR